MLLRDIIQTTELLAVAILQVWHLEDGTDVGLVDQLWVVISLL